MQDASRRPNEAFRVEWYNEPARWSAELNRLHLHTEPNTDFRRITHYGFTRDNGNFLPSPSGRRLPGNGKSEGALQGPLVGRARFSLVEPPSQG